MKTNFMKTVRNRSFAFLLLLPSMAFTVKPIADNGYCIIKDVSPVQAVTAKTATPMEEGTYFFLAVSGVYQKNNVAYVSDIMYYSGYENCSNQKKEVFHREAKTAFNNYLKAHYNDKFPYGSSDITVHEFRGTIAKTGDYMFTRQQAGTRMNSWAGEEKSHGYEVLYTKFGFACE